MTQVFVVLSSVFKYIFTAIIYLFIFGIIRMIFLDIRKINTARPKGIPKGMPYLRLVTDKHSLYFDVNPVYKLDKEILIIGRDAECDISIDDLYLSARHVKLYYNEGEWYIVDLKSTNGTYINGIKMGKKQLILDSEDKIRIGQLEFLVVLE
ncbi:MAG: FHA domain-containing protein [Clostridiaceae bacterium]|nr:FHA domain-containing protein [Clostridiaceae bacterium]